MHRFSLDLTKSIHRLFEYKMSNLNIKSLFKKKLRRKLDITNKHLIKTMIN